MRSILCALVLACVASSASAWDYVPIEQSRSYNAYRGPYWGGYRVIQPGPVGPSYNSMPISSRYQMRYHSLYNHRTGETISGWSF